MNRVWEVPMVTRPGLFPRIVRSLGLVGTLGPAVLATTVLTALGSGTHGLGAAARFGAIAAGPVLNVGLFAIAFRVLTAQDVSWRDVLPGAIIAACGWAVLQALAVHSFRTSRKE